MNLTNLAGKTRKIHGLKIEDKIIIGKFNSLINKVTDEFNNLHPHLATSALVNFWVNDFSRGYIQIVRERLAENDEIAAGVVTEIMVDLMKLCAPICPFLTEHIWQKWKKEGLVKEESVHLTSWPEADIKKIDQKLEREFEQALKIIETGMAQRDEAKIGLRWPLAKAKVSGELKISEELKEIVARQLNVKKVEIKRGKELKVELDTKITPELEAEGFSREFARKIQSERKGAGLKKGDMIKIKVKCDAQLSGMLTKNIHFLKERTNSDKIEFTDGKMPEEAIEFSIKDKKISVIFS